MITTLIATAIHMQILCNHSVNPLEIKSIYIDRLGWRSKEFLHDFITNNSSRYVIRVRNINGPKLIASKSKHGEKFVKSEPNNLTIDNLFTLPKVS